MARSAATAPVLPLLVWHELSAIDQLRRERFELMRRINLYPPYSHRRVVLESRLRELTTRLISAEASIGLLP
ncbi:MAG: hypothetical protein KDK08_27895 [Rhizobiaceae bacterium]|nr:hypothetical protein [Rhizobiaceae bacterium]